MKQLVIRKQEKNSSFFWHLRKFYKKSLVVGDGKTNSSKLKTFGYSMLLAALLILTMLWIFSGNPFENFSTSWSKLWASNSNISRFLVNLSVFGLAGIAVAVGFKTGLFNMGVSGQMTFGGMLAGLVALHAANDMPYGLGQIIVFIVCVLGAMVFAGIAGILKAYFKIHEVVSTIMLNWIAFLLLQAVVRNFIPEFLDATKIKSAPFSEAFSYQYITTDASGKSLPLGGWIALGLLALSAVFIWVVLFKTNIGHKMQMVGKNKDAALAAGVNVKLISVFSMMLSGAIAGVLAVVVYFIRDLRLSQTLADVIPSEGFNGIAISILAFSNPLAIIPVSAIFGLLQALIANSNVIDSNFIDLSLGILLIIVAMNSIFLRLNSRLFIHKLIFGKERHEIYLNFLEGRNNIDSKYFDDYENKKIDKLPKNEISKIFIPHMQEIKNLKEKYKSESLKLSGGKK